MSLAASAPMPLKRLAGWGAWQATCRRSRCSASVWSTDGSCSFQCRSDPWNTVSDACFYLNIWPIAMRCRATAGLQLVDAMSTTKMQQDVGCCSVSQPFSKMLANQAVKKLPLLQKQRHLFVCFHEVMSCLGWGSDTGFAKCARFYHHKPPFSAFTPFTFYDSDLSKSHWNTTKI